MIDNHYAVEYHGQSKQDIEEEHLVNRKKLDEAVPSKYIQSVVKTQRVDQNQLIGIVIRLESLTHLNQWT